MTKLNLPYLNVFKDHYGVRVYVRVAGKRIKIKATIGTPQFFKEYEAGITALTTNQHTTNKVKQGSFDHLVVEYYKSPDFLIGCNPQTQASKRRVIERLRERFKDAPVNRLEWNHVRRLRDEYMSTPTTANRFVTELRVLLNFAIPWMIKVNPIPAKCLIPVTVKGFPTWTETQISQFRETWAVGTKQRLALELMLVTANRGVDTRQLGPQHIVGNMIYSTATKNGQESAGEISKELREALDARPSSHLLFLPTEFGKMFSQKGFTQWFSRAARKAGLPKGFAAHGIRKAATRRMAEAGATDEQMMAVTGHRDARTLRIYTRGANKRLLASAAAAKVRASLDSPVGTSADADEDSGKSSREFAKPNKKT